MKGDTMTRNTGATEKGWNFDNSYTRLPEKFYSSVTPAPVSAPALIVFNNPLAEELGVNAQELQEGDGAEVLAGNKIPEGASPLAQAYAGHQFGHFTMLGDGRAHLLGEQITPEGERIDIQFKGSGRTPYSRGGDGRAGLGPMLREYIMSEAMHALGIPTTRSLAVVTTGDPVYRETEQQGAILTRTASSHLRVGTFEYAVRYCSEGELRELADYTIERHYPEAGGEKNPYLTLLKSVINRQAELIAKWQLAGFIHGVMNTDNTTISGETIDYGPCAFMNTYDPKTVFSFIDVQGRYAYGNQPYIGGWNLARFAEALVPLLDKDDEKAVEMAQDAISAFGDLYRDYYFSGMRKKLGLFNEEEEDKQLIDSLLGMMQKHDADYTNSFLALTYDNTEDLVFSETDKYNDWHKKWQERLERQEQSIEEARKLMHKSNPAVIPRNHRVEEALEAAVSKNDFNVMERLLEVLSTPYEHTEDKKSYTEPPPPSDRPYQTFCGT